MKVSNRKSCWWTSITSLLDLARAPHGLPGWRIPGKVAYSPFRWLQSSGQNWNPANEESSPEPNWKRKVQFVHWHVPWYFVGFVLVLANEPSLCSIKGICYKKSFHWFNSMPLANENIILFKVMLCLAQPGSLVEELSTQVPNVESVLREKPLG